MSTIYAALDAARAEFPTIVKNRTNPHFRSRYADLEAITDAVNPVLRKHNLTVVQLPQVGFLSTEIMLTKENGAIHSVVGAVELPTGVKPQELGSAITYARRYALVTMLGLVTEDDDDGEATSRTRDDEKVKPQPPRAAKPEGWLSDQDCVQAHNELFDRIGKLPADELAKAKAYRQKHGWPMPVDKFNVLRAQVEKVESAAVQSVTGAFPGTEVTKVTK